MKDNNPRSRVNNRNAYILHPFLFAIYSPLFFLAHNFNALPTAGIIPSLVAALVLATVVTIGFKSIFKEDHHRAALMASIVIIIFFSYGHVQILASAVHHFGITLGRHRYLLPIAVGSIGFGYWLIRYKLRDATRVTKIINVMALFLVIFPTINLAQSLFDAYRYQRPIPPEPESTSQILSRVGGSSPDIYYIIVDGYAREDVLLEIYAYDNSSFVQALEDRGFYIGDSSYSNYNKSILSIASSLNMNYVQEYLEDQAVGPTWGFLTSLINENLVEKFLAKRGYEFTAFESGYKSTQIEGADHYISFYDGGGVQIAGHQIRLNALERSMFETSLLSAVADGLVKVDLYREFNEPFESHRARVLKTFQTLQRIPDWEGNHFVFAHIVSPHPPFVFSSDGLPLNPKYSFTFKDGNELLDLISREDYIQSYRDQVQYINTLILQTVDSILINSSEPPIVILQADHGPGAFTDFGSLDLTYPRERFAILNAYYLPGDPSDLLYPSVSPVNSFRIVLNEYFDENLSILEDKSYFAAGGVADLHLVPDLEGSPPDR